MLNYAELHKTGEFRPISRNARSVTFFDGQHTITAYRPVFHFQHPRNSIISHGFMLCETCLGKQYFDGDHGMEPCPECAGDGFTDMAARDRDHLIDAENQEADQHAWRYE